MVQEENKKQQYNESRQAQVIEDFIRQLLDDPIDEEEEDEYDPNVLDPAIVFQEDTKFINGVKKMPSASRPMKSASMPPMVSEVEIMTSNKEHVYFQIYYTDKDLVCIVIPGIAGEYYISTNMLQIWLDRGIDKGEVHILKGNNQKMVEVTVGEKFLSARSMREK